MEYMEIQVVVYWRFGSSGDTYTVLVKSMYIIERAVT
jgi:hypothetical protein